MKIKINPNLWGSILMMAVSIGLLAAIPSQIENVQASSAIGPRFMPSLSAALILVISVIQLISEIMKKDKRRRIEIDLGEQKRILITILCMAVFYIVSGKWNIVVPSIVLGCVLLVIMRCRKWSYYAIVAATGIVLYLASKYLIHIRF